MQKALDTALHFCPYIGMSMTADEYGMRYIPNPSPALLSDKMPIRLGGEETGKRLFCLVCGSRSLDLAVYHGLTDCTGVKRFLV
ncbi:MAG: hypothetical protein K6E53_07145 [Lachnospiraceae bacterium]|nr:hypothetical protein [Lachnospiraceae bacterium]